jgi:hypothetical protein
VQVASALSALLGMNAEIRVSPVRRTGEGRLATRSSRS